VRRPMHFDKSSGPTSAALLSSCSLPSPRAAVSVFRRFWLAVLLRFFHQPIGSLSATATCHCIPPLIVARDGVSAVRSRQFQMQEGEDGQPYTPRLLQLRVVSALFAPAKRSLPDGYLS